MGWSASIPKHLVARHCCIHKSTRDLSAQKLVSHIVENIAFRLPTAEQVLASGVPLVPGSCKQINGQEAI